MTVTNLPMKPADITPTAASDTAVVVIQSPVSVELASQNIIEGSTASFTVITGVTSQQVFVTGYAIVVSAPTTFQFIDTSAQAISLTGRMNVTASGGVSYAGSIHTIAFKAVSGTGMGVKVSQSGSAQIGGHITFLQE